MTFETGSNRWRSLRRAGRRRTEVEQRALYFRRRWPLAFEAARRTRGHAIRRFVSDPGDPVPYRPRPIRPTYSPGGSKWSTWLVEDQRFVHDRPDVLSWETEPLEADVSVAGDIVARLFASTTGTDGDWIVKLIDVYPEQYAENRSLGGYQFMVANEVFRGRYRKSFEKPAADHAERRVEYTHRPAHAELHASRRGTRSWCRSRAPGSR